MNFKRNGGFTLVELIVVIAILAILAGVAVPVYSGYIAKANEAADLQLLGALNSAFTAACVENGEVVDDAMVGAEFTMTGTEGDMKISGLTLPQAVEGRARSGEKAAKIFASFQNFYGANMDKGFKVFVKIVFTEDGSFEGYTADEVAQGGSMKDNGDGTWTITTTSGTSVTVSATDLDALKNSTFGEMGADALLNELDTVTNLAASMIYTNAGGTVEAMLNDYEFLRFYLKNAGVTGTEGMSYEDIDANLEALQPNGNQIANAAVLYAAQNANKMDRTDITAFLNESNGTMYQSVMGNMNGENSSTAMTQAALAYGMYLAFNRNQGNTDDVDSTVMMSVMTGQSADSDEFRAYLNSAQGQADLNAYLAALNMVDSNTQSNSGLVNNTINNGFNTTDLQELLGQAMK